MKRLRILFGISVILAIFILPFFANAQTAQNVKITLLNHEPDPVEPGDVVEARFKIENTGKETQDVSVEILPSYPFSLYSGGAVRNIGKLRSGQTGEDAIIVDYKLKVDENAAEGENEIELRATIGKIGLLFVENQFLIDVRTSDAILDIKNVAAVPDQIVPGRQGLVTVTIKNAADSLLKNIRLKLDLTNVPFGPVEGSSERTVSQLNSKSLRDVNFTLKAEPDAESKLYKIPLEVVFFDSRGNRFNRTDFISLGVGDKPELNVYIKNADIKRGEKGSITLEIANSGLTGVKFLGLTLKPSDDYVLLSPSNYVYIGDIDSDDTETEDFELFVEKKKKEAIIPVKISYKDANNIDYEEEFSLKLAALSDSELKKFEKTSYGWVATVLIIIAIAIYIYYKRFRKK